MTDKKLAEVLTIKDGEVRPRADLAERFPDSDPVPAFDDWESYERYCRRKGVEPCFEEFESLSRGPGGAA